MYPYRFFWSLLIAIALGASMMRPQELYAQNETAPPVPSHQSEDPTSVLRSPTSSRADREEAARRLIVSHTPESRQALVDALIDLANPRGQLAVARAVALAHDPDEALLDPLFAMAIGDSNSEAAIQALANYRRAEVWSRLLDYALDPDRQRRESTRVAAIRAIASMTEKRAARALVEILSSENESQRVRREASDALAAMTGLRSHGPQDWRAWWEENRHKDEATFEGDVLRGRAAQMVRQQIRLDRVLDETQAILTESYQIAPDRAKEGILLRYLRAEEPRIRMVGVQLIHEDFISGRLIPPAVAQLRTMVGDSAPEVRLVVARALWALNDAAAFEAILQQLEKEPNAEVRAALAEALVPMRDLRVIPHLLRLLRDPSLNVAETAARGLATLGQDIELGAVIRNDRRLSAQLATELREVLEKRTGSAGTVTLRAALVDAMGTLQDPELRNIFISLLQVERGEASTVRRAAARALGEISQPWVANILVSALNDPDDGVRLDTLSALAQASQSFEPAERIFERLKPDRETSAAVRQRAWDTLCALFPMAEPSELARWADRFMDDPPRRYVILAQLGEQLQKRNEEGALAAVHQDLGETLMKMGDFEKASVFFDMALRYYQGRRPADLMTTGGLTEQLMDALLAGNQFQKAVDLAARSIAANPEFQPIMGAKLRNRAEILNKNGNTEEALALIAAVRKMTPALAEPFKTQIDTIERDIRQQGQPATPEAPASVLGNSQSDFR